MIGRWVALAVVLPPLFPNLAQVTQNQPISPLPTQRPGDGREPSDERGVPGFEHRQRAPGAPDQRQGAWTG